jgi:hypothetical protein
MGLIGYKKVQNQKRGKTKQRTKAQIPPILKIKEEMFYIVFSINNQHKSNNLVSLLNTGGGGCKIWY